MIAQQWKKQEKGYQITGELTRDTVPQLWQYLKQWQPESNEVEVSLNEIGRVDSAGMVMLIHLIQNAKQLNCHIMLSFVPEQLRTLFQLSNVESILLKHIKE